MLKGGSTRCRPNSSTSTILMKVGRTFSTRNTLSVSRFYFSERAENPYRGN